MIRVALLDDFQGGAHDGPVVPARCACSGYAALTVTAQLA
jgi:hypothetical protein